MKSDIQQLPHRPYFFSSVFAFRLAYNRMFFLFCRRCRFSSALFSDIWIRSAYTHALTIEPTRPQVERTTDQNTSTNIVISFQAGSKSRLLYCVNVMILSRKLSDGQTDGFSFFLYFCHGFACAQTRREVFVEPRKVCFSINFSLFRRCSWCVLLLLAGATNCFIHPL